MREVAHGDPTMALIAITVILLFCALVVGVWNSGGLAAKLVALAIVAGTFALFPTLFLTFVEAFQG